MEDWNWPPAYDESYRPPPGQPYWFPRRETMPAAAREAKILERVQQVMAYAWERSPFYRRKWEEAGIHPSAVRSLEDYERVPVVTKAELRRSQADHGPFGDYLCIEDSEVFHIHGTSGTTGRPTAFGIAHGDWRAIANAHARVMWSMGIRPADTVFIGSFFSLYMGSWGALIGAERLGARCFPFGAGVPGQTERAVTWMASMQPTCFYGTPSYGIHLAETAESLGLDPRSFGVRVLFLSGEPGASVPAIREKLEDLYRGQVFDCGSMAEVSPWMNLGESLGRVGPLLWQDVVYTEVCDPGSHARVQYGNEGTPVYTTLERISQPMIRLFSGDVTRWDAGPSPCGRTYPHLPKGIYGRLDDQFTVRGENILPSAIDEVVAALRGYGGEHRILVSRLDAMDELTVQLEYAASVGDVAALRRRAEAELRRTLGVNTKVLMVAPGTLERTEFKARRVIDSREVLRQARA